MQIVIVMFRTAFYYLNILILIYHCSSYLSKAICNTNTGNMVINLIRYSGNLKSLKPMKQFDITVSDSDFNT
jgi:hypothetical protein